MKFSIMVASLLIFLVGLPQEEKQPVFYIKHLEAPLHYPPLARQVQIQGTVIVKLTIATDGKVLAAESPDAHPLLKYDTEKLPRKWALGCAFCSSATPYEKTIKFVYHLEGEGISYDDTRVVMDLPQEVLITASPGECDRLPKNHPMGGTK